ncbi:MAG: muramoyltetrapeptide carboxypeptidase [Verrucomicrobiales bacterium]
MIGYSDATALLIDLSLRSNLVTFHGPMLYDLRGQPDRLTWRSFEEVLCKKGTLIFDQSSTQNCKVLRAGRGDGPIVGGNLSLLVNLIGTPSDFQTDGRILFIEDVDERLYALDRLLLHMSRANRLKGLNGLLVGQLGNISDDEIPFGQTFDEMIQFYCSEYSFPIISGCPFGHGAENVTIPIGVHGELDASDSDFSLRLSAAAVN